MKKTTLVVGIILFGNLAFAGDCTITTDRKACPGKEAEVLKPYNGKNPTEETKKFDDVGACEKWAEKSAKIIRKGTLAEKKVSAKFDGKDLGKSFSDKSDCK